MTDTKPTVKISVRSLVEYVLRCGDLSFGFAGSSRALEGARAHRRYQRGQPAGYQAEVTLAARVETAELILLIGGRADGIFTDDDEIPVVDEIKTTTTPLESFQADDHPLFWAQARCYAHMYAVEQRLATVGVRLTYYHLDTREIRQFVRFFTADDLSAFFNGLVASYLAWAAKIQQWQTRRNTSISSLSFPFPVFRPGQRELAVAVYRAVGSGRKLFAQAPTGIGKTLATIFPAVKTMTTGKLEKIFYLTAKTVTKELAELAFDRLRRQGLLFKTVTITAKEKICPTPGASCSPAECARACGHYDRVTAAIDDVWEREYLPREVIAACAERHRVCPYELSLDLALWADGVICDYNYVFDPRVYLRRFFGDGGREGDYCFLVDEAHNLVDRAREMFSAELTRQSFQSLKRALGKETPPLRKALQAVITWLGHAGKACDVSSGDELRQEEAPLELLTLLHRFAHQAEARLVHNEPTTCREDLLELYFAANTFLRVAETYDQRFVTYTCRSAGTVRIKLFCRDPSHLLQEALQRGRSTVFFSATLAPPDYFTDLLGGEATDGFFRVPSPFPREHFGLFIADHIALTYQFRNGSYDPVLESVAALTGERTGNYLVFAPSYQYMEELYRRFTTYYPNIRCLCQSSGMSETARSEFLAAFSSQLPSTQKAGDSVPGPDTLIGFAVLGGVFGEGIDLIGDRLSGVVIIGVGLPQLGGERDMIRDYYAAHNQQGFEYAYQYPGMNKVLQAVGRVIRSEQDRGVALLIDQRFGYTAYRNLLPPEWRTAQRVRGPGPIANAARDFWQRQSSPGSKCQ